MAYDLRGKYHRLHSATYSAPPTALSHRSFSRDNEEGSRYSAFDGDRPDKLWSTNLSTAHSLSVMTKDTNVRKVAAVTDDSHASTPPIDVPASFLQDGLPFPPQALPLDGSPYTPSPLENFLRNRRTSITFNPQVTLESGQRRGLEEPLPKLEINTKLRQRPILQDLSRHKPSSSLVPPYSETERSTCDAVVGGRTINCIPLDFEETKSPVLVNRPYYPLVLRKSQGLASGKEQTDVEEGASLTSDSSSSSILSEIKTPKDDNMVSIVSPRSICTSIHSSTSFQDVTNWPILQRPASAPRAKSYSFNRKGDIRQGYRQGSRRSTASSNSPASAFLSRFAREEMLAAPDDEGQEVGEYVLGRQIGFGGSSVVKEAFTIEGSTRVCRAVKIVRKQVANKEDLENERFQAEFEREVGLWRCLSHRYVLSLIAVHVTPFATFCFTQFSSGGTLFDLVRVNRQGLRGDLARRYSYQLASAIRYLHEDMRVVHRDIKLENCLVHRDPNPHPDGADLLLCDFGLAEFEVNEHSRDPPDLYGRDMTSTSDELPGLKTCFVGSLEYASPELILGPPGFFSRAIDIWALGVVIYALLLGDLPFQHPLPSRVQQRILAGEWNADALRHVTGPAGAEEAALEVVHGCLRMRSEERWVISQVLDGRWLNECPEMLDELSERWTC